LEDVGALVIGEEFVEFGFRVDVGADGWEKLFVVEVLEGF
jgi:hypothetical protein